MLQGRDASGKDGTIRKILEFSNIQQSYVHPFKVPTEEERAHDFLWRAHKAVPRRGHVTLFNRSHYEDVLAARVHRLVPEAIWKARYAHINAFERLIVDDADVIVLKFYLHISADEQYERLRAREKDPRTAWKLNPEDWREVPLWDEFTEAYEDVLARCATREAPWYLVPADKKWFRNLAVHGADRAGAAPVPEGLARHAEGDRQEPDEGDPRPARPGEATRRASRAAPGGSSR